MGALNGFDAKIRRTKEHLGTFQASVRSYLDDPEAYSIIEEPDLETGVFTYRLHVYRQPPSEEWSLLFGDCIHNLRAALDHLFWALVLLKHPKATDDPKVVRNHWKANFPIYGDRTRFVRRQSDLEYFVGKDALATLERMQPYHGLGAGKGLQVINECDVTDKHRLLVPMVALAIRSDVFMDRGKNNSYTGPIDIEHTAPPTNMETGAVVGKITISPPKAVVKVNYKPTLNVILKMDGLTEVFTPESTISLIEVVEAVRRVFAARFDHRGARP